MKQTVPANATGSLNATRAPRSLQAQVPREAAGKRLDAVAAELFPEYSRARLQSWIKAGALTVNQATVKANSKLIGGEHLHLTAEEEPQGEWQAEEQELAIVFEDDTLMVINKPAGLVVHPAAGNYDGTLLNGLLHHCPELRNIPRAGIVHRLDKDTTGLMVVAKTLAAQTSLVAQLQARTVSRSYCALVVGQCPASGIVDAPIARDPKNRKKMAVVPGGKEAETHYQCVKRLGPLSWVTLQLKTGRTHQIRVHMTHEGYPLVGDPMYGSRRLRKADLTAEEQAAISGFDRQALHAYQLRLIHPSSGEEVGWQAPLPDDLRHLLKVFDYEFELA